MTNKSSEDIPADQLDETWDELDESLPPRRKRGKLTAWQGVAIGIGVGIALTAGAGTLLSRQPSTGKTENNTQQAAQPSSTVTVAQAQTSPIART
ncbi:hypothetical protein NDI49_33320, partial [Trichocoleus sp. ST-U3]